jgi:hypothetical protein
MTLDRQASRLIENLGMVDGVKSPILAQASTINGEQSLNAP